MAGVENEIAVWLLGERIVPKGGIEVANNLCSAKQFILYLEILRASRHLSSLRALGKP